jgi:hypothetical protein
LLRWAHGQLLAFSARRERSQRPNPLRSLISEYGERYAAFSYATQTQTKGGPQCHALI